MKSISTEHADLVSALVLELHTTNAEDDCLDEIVLDGAGELGSSLANERGTALSQADAISAGEEFGSEINNGGFSDQIAFIISGNGPDEAANLVRRAAGLHVKRRAKLPPDRRPILGLTQFRCTLGLF